MSPHALLRLYPRAWRERYGTEFVALLEQAGLDRRRTANVVIGAARERLRSVFIAMFGATARRAMICPSCRTAIDRDEWFQFWTRSSVLGGSAVRPCASCGSLMRLSSARLIERTLLFVGMTLQMVIGGLYLSGAVSGATRLASTIIALLLIVVSGIAGRRTRLEIVPIDFGETAS